MLDGCRCTVFTDPHKSLIYTLSHVSDPWTARKCRQLPKKWSSHQTSATSPVQPTWWQTLSIGRQQGGKLNLSPPSLPVLPAGVADEHSTACISLTKMAACGITWPLVPLLDRAAVFHAIHSVAHPDQANGISMFCLEGCGKRRGSYVYVPRLPAVPALKSSRAFSSSTSGHSSPSTHILHMHLDLVGPLPAPSPSEGQVYLLTTVDRLTSGWKPCHCHGGQPCITGQAWN